MGCSIVMVMLNLIQHLKWMCSLRDLTFFSSENNPSRVTAIILNQTKRV
jgi:hypothetical protein